MCFLYRVAQEIAYCLVGGWTNTSENILVKLDHFPRVRDENSKNIWVATTQLVLHHPKAWVCFRIIIINILHNSKNPRPRPSTYQLATRGLGKLEFATKKNMAFLDSDLWKNGWPFGWMFGLLKKKQLDDFFVWGSKTCVSGKYTPKTCVWHWYSSSYSWWSLISSGISERCASLKNAVGHGNSCCKQISMRSEHLRWIKLYGLCSILTNTITQTYPMFWFVQQHHLQHGNPIHCSETLSVFLVQLSSTLPDFADCFSRS